MKTLFRILFILIFSSYGVCRAQAAKEELQQAATGGVADELANTPDGATIRLTPDGGFQVFAVGTGTYDLDDVDEIQDAQKEATLKAKANLAKFMNESLSTEEGFAEASTKSKKITSENGQETATVNKETVKTQSTMIKNHADALLKGVIVLMTSKVPGKGASGTYRVMVGVSSKTLEAVSKVTGGIAAAGNLPPAAPAAGSDGAVGGTSQCASAAGALPEGWIECVGQGTERNLAVNAALMEGIGQVYGTALQNDSRFKERSEKMKTNSSTLHVGETESESETLTKTAGFVRAYKIVEVKPVADGRLEARVYALITNPRAGGALALLLMTPTAVPELITRDFDIGPNRRLSGAEIAKAVGKAFNTAFARTNECFILTMDDLQAAMAGQNMAQTFVNGGFANTSELMKCGQMLTADVVLSVTIEDLSYSSKVGIDKVTNKFSPQRKMGIRLSYKMTSVSTGQQMVSDDLAVALDNEEINHLLAEDEDADLLLALMSKVSFALSEKLPK